MTFRTAVPKVAFRSTLRWRWPSVGCVLLMVTIWGYFGGLTMSTRLVGQEMTSLWTRQRGADWPTFLGPRSDNSSTETGILTKWPADGPRIVWQRELGEGYGIGSTSRGRFYQADRLGNLARLSCLHAETGQLLWKFEYPTSYVDMYGYDGGPRCSPVIEDDRVYLFGVEGMLHCLDAASGEPRWKCNTARRFGVVQNFFGVGSTPILCGDLLICIVGGSPEQDQSLPRGQLDRVTPNGSAIVAFDKMTGQVRYKTGNDLAGYAAPILARIGQRQWCFAFCRQGLLAFEPERGTIDFHLPWRSKKLESVNASTPVVVGNEVFISETYGPGSCLLRVSPGQYDIVWQDQLRRREKAMQAHWNTPIYHQGHLYGCSGRNPPDAELRCVEWKTGQVKWSEYTGRRSSLLYVDGHFVCLDERGKLQLIKANPKRLEVVAETVLSDGSGRSLLRYPCWAAPILSHGLLYVRGRERLVCLELIPERG